MKVTIGLLVTLCCCTSQVMAQIRAVDVDKTTGFAKAVVVKDRALLHTQQIYPYGKIGVDNNVAVPIESNNVTEQTTLVMQNLGAVLNFPKSSLKQLVVLNVYVTKEEDVPQVTKAIVAALPKGSHPAVRFVVTPLEEKKALIAIDAIATANHKKRLFITAGVALTNKEHRARYVVSGILHKGRALYISGMASRSKNLKVATAETLKQLEGILKLLDLKKDNVVHLKAYMKPMSDVQTAKDEIKKFFPNDAPFAPPVSFVEWKNGLPIEIEMIVYIPDSNKTVKRFQGVSHRWRPKEKQSPVYCRFAIVDSDTRIYLSGMMPRTGNTPEERVQDIFKQMKQTLKKTDSNLEHLVKATYYVAKDDVSKALNAVRPKHYHPQHPPAASKATIQSTGYPQQTITIDMLAVPAK